MEQSSYPNPILQTQEQLQNGLTAEIRNDFNGAEQIIWLNDIETKYGFDTDKVHPETLRALCHYAAVATGEVTNTAVLFRRVNALRGEGYSQQEVGTYEFIIAPRAEPLPIKRDITYERRPQQTDRSDNDIASAVRNQQSQSRHDPVPGHVRRMINSRREY